MGTIDDGRNWLIAVTVATEVPPPHSTGLSETDTALARRAVCEVIRHRVASPAFPNDPVLVVLQPNQFSAVGREDYWRRACAGLWQHDHVLECLATWNTKYPDEIAPGALWYYSPVSMIPKGSAPSWAHFHTEVPTPIDPQFFRFYR